MSVMESMSVKDHCYSSTFELNIIRFYIFPFSFLLLLLYQILVFFLIFLIIDLTLTFPFFLLRETSPNSSCSLSINNSPWSNLLCSASASICKQAFVSSSVSYGRIQAITTRQTPPSLHHSQFYPPSICTHKHSTISEISSQLNQLIDAVSIVLLIIVKWVHSAVEQIVPCLVRASLSIPWCIILKFQRLL